MASQAELSIVRDLLNTVDDYGGGGWAVLSDFLEERAWHRDLVHYATAYLLKLTTDQQGEMVTPAPRAAWARLLGELAKTDYPLAVERADRIKLPRRDYDTLPMIVDAMNTAHCTGRRHGGEALKTTWQERIEEEQMEQVTGEVNGLGPWEVIDSEGRETRRRWTIDFAPEYLEHELQQQYGDSATFKTVWYNDGGNFGPAFDQTLRDKDGLWRSVQQFAAGTEPQCPYAYDVGPVSLEQTYCGEHPGKKCAMCEADLGDPHENIYLGELGAAVFMLDVMEAVTDIHIVEEEGGDYWRIAALTADEEVILPELDLRPDGNGFNTLAEANAFVDRLTAGRTVLVQEFPLEGDE